MWWHTEHFKPKENYLKTRACLLKAIRQYFDKHNFIEVETPCLQISPGMEPHLKAFKTQLLDQNFDVKSELYLHTSPEFSMKKLLVAGMERIYQICKTFRNAEGSRFHRYEFTILEWYKTQISYQEFIGEVQDFIRHCAHAFNIDQFSCNDMACDPFRQWEIISVCEAFSKYAGIDLEKHLHDLEGFKKAGEASGVILSRDDEWDDIFFKILLEKIEPNLGKSQPAILYDYPVHMAALARPKKDDPRFAERFEVYICAMELGNAFGELTDPDIQLERYKKDMNTKQRLYGESWPVDQDFIDALRHGMPDCCGIAIGIDRLVMLVSGADHIDDVNWVPLPGGKS